MDKRQFLEQTINNVRNIDISNVLGRYLNLSRRGGSYFALCPFHNDRKLGSFVVTPSKGIFKCFSCGVGGDSIKFLAQHKNINYVESAFEIALQEGLINQEDYEEYFTKRRYSKSEIQNIEKVYVELDKTKLASNIANIDTLDKVFNTFLSVLKLKDEHTEYLKNSRGLSDEIIEQRQYRSCQLSTDTFMGNFIKALEEANIEYMNKKGKDVLEFIPGFYQKKSKGEWEWTFPYNKGIFLPIRNVDGKIQGLQIRRDEKEEDKGRYIWFSSSFASFNERFKYGTSSGSPMDVLYPNKMPKPILFITEGRFKSEVIIQKIGSVCISLQGVGNWKNIDELIKEADSVMKKQYPETKESEGFKGFVEIFIAFDSDMSYKYTVYEQLRKMSDYVATKTDTPIFYLHWTEGFKGIDDLLFHSDCKTPKECEKLFNIYRKDYWDIEYNKQVVDLLKKKGLEHPRDLGQDDLIEIEIEIEIEDIK